MKISPGTLGKLVKMVGGEIDQAEPGAFEIASCMGYTPVEFNPILLDVHQTSRNKIAGPEGITNHFALNLHAAFSGLFMDEQLAAGVAA